MEKIIQTLLGIAAKLAAEDTKEDSCNVSEILLQDLLDTQEICETIIAELENNQTVDLVNVIQVARYTLRLAHYINTHQDNLEEKEARFLVGVCEGNILKGAIELYETESEFIKIDREEVLNRFKAALPCVKENQDIITYNKKYKVQGIYEMLDAVLETFHFYNENPSCFNSAFVVRHHQYQELHIIHPTQN